MAILIILGIIILIVLLKAFQKQKGEDTPESLEKYFEDLIEHITTLIPLSEIFDFHSNDGNQIIFKEKTVSRDCLIIFERYKIILSVTDKKSNIEQRFEDSDDIHGTLTEVEFIEKIHALYVKGAHKVEITK